MRSLRLRIVLAVALVCAATLAGVASYVGHATLLVRVGEPPRRTISAVRSALALPLRKESERQSTAAVQSELARLAARYSARIIVVNAMTGAAFSSWGPIASHDVAMQPDGTIELKQRTPGATPPMLLLLRGGSSMVDGAGRPRWRLFVLPADSAIDALAPARLSILRSIWQSAALGIAAAVVVAILLGSYIVKPIRELTMATKAMRGGDTTRRVAVTGNDEIAQLGDAFNAMAESIETTEQLRRRMITDVAHELRNPLTRMIVQLEAADDGHMTQKEALAGVGDEARRLERIVNDLRDLSLADANELNVVKGELAIDRCINEAVFCMQPRAAQNNVTLEADVAPGLPAALGDELRVAQILDNLIANALQSTPAGGRVVVGATAVQTHIQCFVQDDGPGIPSEQLSLIFERFYRADASRHRATGGSGLGLAIVKSFVEAQGGSVSVASRVDRGSRFTWTLPIVGTRLP